MRSAAPSDWRNPPGRGAGGPRVFRGLVDAGADQLADFAFVEHFAFEQGFGERIELVGVLVERALGAVFGGVQEETTALGVPCLTLRENTERPITVEQGTNVLVGLDHARIVAGAKRALDDPPPKRAPQLWDGRAGERVAAVLLAHVDNPSRYRPTELRPEGA